MLGIDVNYQSATLVPWHDVRITFGIVKASEGLKGCASAKAHADAICAANKPLGAYHVFHPDVDVRTQLSTFLTITSEFDYGQSSRHIVPALDVERFTISRPVTPEWSLQLLHLAVMFATHFDSNPLIYCSRGTWNELGHPQWMLDYPLWVPFWPEPGHVAGLSISPSCSPGGMHPSIWQYVVCPLWEQRQNSSVPGAVDHNLSIELPLLT